MGPARGSRGRQHFQVAWEETEGLRKALEAQLVRATNPNQTLVPPATAQLGAPIQRLCHIQPPGRKSRVHRDDARRGRWANARDGGAARTRRGSAAVVRACRGLATYAGGQAASPGRSAMRSPPSNELSQPHPYPSLCPSTGGRRTLVGAGGGAPETRAAGEASSRSMPMRWDVSITDTTDRCLVPAPPVHCHCHACTPFQSHCSSTPRAVLPAS